VYIGATWRVLWIDLCGSGDASYRYRYWSNLFVQYSWKPKTKTANAGNAMEVVVWLLSPGGSSCMFAAREAQWMWVWSISYVLPKQVCVQLPTSADNVTLLAVVAERRPCSNRSISTANRAHSSKPAAAACGDRMVGCMRTDKQTELTPDSFRNPALHTMRTVSCKSNKVCLSPRWRRNHVPRPFRPLPATVRLYDVFHRGVSYVAC